MSEFEVSGTRIFAVYTRVGDKIVVDLASTSTASVDTGGVGEAPVVKGVTVKSLQRAELERR